MVALRRIVRIIFFPKDEWDTIARESASVDLLLRRYILPLSFLAPIATLIGMKYFDVSWDAQQGYVVPAQEIYSAAATTLFASISSVFGLAAIFVLLAPMYGSSRDFNAALKVSTFGAVPVMVAGATLVLPVMAIVGLIGLCHSLYVFWLGARQVLHVKSQHQTEFVGISLLMLSGFSVVAGAAASGFGLF